MASLRSLLFAGLLALAACSSRPPPLPPVALPGLNHGQCLATLSARGVAYQPVAIPASKGPCQIDNPVSVAGAAVPWNQSALMDCELAVEVERFEREVVQPAARRTLGHAVREIENFGAYACRRETGSRGHLSQHAYGKAIDIKGFVLDDGSRIRVADDWRTLGRRRDFLHEIARAACGYFSVVLTPNTDSYHQDNIHLDIGPDRLCSV